MAGVLVYIHTAREKSWEWFVGHAHRPHALGWLALVSFTDAIVSPLAPEVFLVALMLAHPNRWRSYLATAVASTIAGAAVGYYIAVFLFHQFGEPLLAFYHLENAFAMARHLMMGHVFITMALASFTPIPDKVFIYAGGFLGVHFIPYIVGYFLGRSLRMALVVYLTGRYGQAALNVFAKYILWLAPLVFALVAGYVIVHLHLFGL
jgi:membrane protein YqaA with SNARE-associated domain